MIIYSKDFWIPASSAGMTPSYLLEYECSLISHSCHPSTGIQKTDQVIRTSHALALLNYFNYKC